jgi:spoIIIJ-associated protein
VNSQLQLGKQWLEELLQLMGLATTVKTEGFATIPSDSHSVWLNIDISSLTPEQKELLIGHQGENIDAIQYLANTLLNISHDSESQGSYTIEIDEYRVRRHEELVEIVEEKTAQVRETGQEVAIYGLSSAERKQIHSFLEDTADLTTESRGQEPDRRLVIRLNQD